MQRACRSQRALLLCGCLFVGGGPAGLQAVDVRVSVSGKITTVPAEVVSWKQAGKKCDPRTGFADAGIHEPARAAFFIVPITPAQRGHVLRLSSPAAGEMSARWMGTKPPSVVEEMYFATGARGRWFPSANPYNGRAELVVPSARAGKLLVFVRGDDDPPVDLVAELLPSLVLSSNPKVASEGEVTVRVRGGGFRDTSRFVFKGPVTAVGNAVVLSPSEAIVTATLRPGQYDLEHRAGGCASELEDALKVLGQGAPPLLRVETLTAGSYVQKSIGTLAVRWENVGGRRFGGPVLLRVTADAPAEVYMTLADKEYGEGSIARRFDPALLGLWDQGVYILAVSENGTPLQPGESAAARIHYFSSDANIDDEIEFRVRGHSPGGAVMPPLLSRPEGIAPTEWVDLYARIRADMAGMWKNLAALFGDEARRSAAVGVPPYSVRRLFERLVDKYSSTPPGVLAGFAYDTETGASALCAYCVAQSTTDPTKTFTVPTDEQGRFFFGRLPADSYRLEVLGATGQLGVKVAGDSRAYISLGVRDYKPFLHPDTGVVTSPRYFDHLRHPSAGAFATPFPGATTVVIGPRDPNSKNGPSGPPPIPPEGPWDFTINFENVDGAPAQEIVVTDDFRAAGETDFIPARISLGIVAVEDGYTYDITPVGSSDPPLSSYETGQAWAQTAGGYYLVLDWKINVYNVEWVIGGYWGSPGAWSYPQPFLDLNEGGSIDFTVFEVDCEPPTHNEGVIHMNGVPTPFYYDATLCPQK